jgi:hypothetical protein
MRTTFLRRFLPAAVLAASALAGLGVFARGTWADTAPRDPEPGEGPVAQVLRVSDGAREVRACVHLPFPPEQVWLAITDYEHYGDVCQFLHAAEMSQGPEGCRVRGQALTGLSTSLPFAMELRHRQDLHEWTSAWDQAEGSVTVNRGRWQVRAAGETDTLLAISLEVQVRGVPTFLLRNLSRHRLCEVLRAVERRLRDGPSGRPW